MGSFFSIEIAKRGLFAQQRAQQTTAHNITNANTEGYSRQRTDLESAYMRFGGLWEIGMGVNVSDVSRIRDSFTDMQIRNELSGLAEWDVQSELLRQVEDIFNEPTDIGVSAVLNRFWESLETLSNDAGSSEARETVKERAVTLASTINHTANQLHEMQNDINFRINVKVDKVNSLASQISDLNQLIQTMETSGKTAPDLRDKRDILVDELSSLVSINTYEDENGLFTVNVGGAILVKGSDCETMKFDGTDPNARVKWEKYDTEVRLSKGELKGLVELRDEKIGNYITQLKEFAKNLSYEFNEIHKSGYDLYGRGGSETDGIDFFVFNPDDPVNCLTVNPEIVHDPSRIAAAASPSGLPDDNRNVLRLAGLRSTRITGLNGTLDDFYGTIISRLGVDSQEAQRMAESQEYMVSQLEERRKQISGVSIDEEMTKMIMYQHAYNAAARMITAVDQMIDTVVNRMGVAGR